jgi:Zn-dependent membrane protease YugP
MTVIIFIIAIAAIIFGPGLWVRRVLERYSVPADRYSGTGAQLARHLLDKHGLTDVVVESTPDGDHYDPEAKAVRLTPDKFDGRSLTAITVAAHEVGHALQDHEGYAPLKIRSQLVRASRNIEKLGAGVLLISSTLVHFATLPTEFNASFARALPMLDEYRILKTPDRRHARRLLKAAALTYVSASLMSLLNIARWWAILRR